MANAAPFTVAVDSRLSDDTLSVGPLSVNPDATAGTAIAAASDGTTYLFAALALEGACELQSSTSSASGYTPVPLPSGTGATEIVALVDSQQNVHAFWATDAAVLHSTRAPNGSWSVANSLAAATSLGVSQVPLSNSWLVYGISSDGNLVLYIYSTSTQAWGAFTVEINSALLDAGISLQAGISNSFTLFAAVGGALNIWSGTWSTTGGEITSSSPAKVTVANPVTQTFFSYYHGGSAMIMFGDNQNNLYTSVGFSTAPSLIPGSQVASGSGFVGSDTFIRFYGADPDGNLWVLRQASWNESTPVWASIFPLDLDVTYVAAPAQAGSQVSLLVTCADSSIDFLFTSASTQTSGNPWTRLPLQAPSDPLTPLRTTRYRTSLTITDANGCPCTGAVVNVTPSSLVGLEVSGQTVIAAPDQPAVLTADVSGTVTFTQPALSLDSVTFQVTGTNIPDTVSVTPYQYINDQLSGTSPVFTGSATIQAMSQETLLSATVNGQPLAPSLSNNLASAASQGIIAAATGLASLGSSSSTTGFILDMQAATFNWTSQQELQIHIAGLGVEQGLGSDIAQFAEDIWHAIKQGAMKVMHWVVDTVNKVVTAVVQFVNQVVATIGNLVAEGFAAVAGFVHGVFAWIGAEVEKVLDWLKDLLGWTSIWNTMLVFNNHLNTGLNNLNTWLGQMPVLANTFFQDLKSDIDAGFSQAKQSLAKTTFSQSSGGASLSRRSLAATTSSNFPPPMNFPGSPTQLNWFLSKLTSYLPGSAFLDQLNPKFPSGFYNTINNAWTKSELVQDIETTLTPLKNFFKAHYDNPKDLWQTAVKDLLSVLQGIVDIILDGLDALTDTIIYAVQTAIAMVQDIINTPLQNIPVLSWLWENIIIPSNSNEPMTLGKLACLVMAVPVTLACEIVDGSAPFNAVEAKTASATSSGFQNAQFWFSAFLAFVDSINDAANVASSESDTVNPLILLWNWLDVVANAVEVTLFCPVDGAFNWSSSWSSLTKGQQYSFGTWMGYWAPVTTDGLCACVNTYLCKQGLNSSSLLSRVQQLLDSIFGLVTCGTGTAGAVFSNEGVVDVASAFCWPLPWGTSFLCLPSVVDGSSGASFVVKVVIDCIGDVDW
jgi:hypothetical protein